MTLFCMGISHQTAPVSIREPFAFSEKEIPGVLRQLGTRPGLEEAVLLSTCNRVELYAATLAPCEVLPLVREWFAQRHRLRKGEEFAEFETRFYLHQGAAAINHLFRVASGLESMILGETEILGQVKRAYALAADTGLVGRHLHKFFQRAFRVAKETRTRTGITRHPASVGSAAVDLAEQLFGSVLPCRVMILGAGETSEMTARALLARGIRSIIVSNRSYDRAVRLATEMGGEAIHFTDWESRLPEIDILISSTAAPRAVVTEAKLRPLLPLRNGRPLLIIDLAVPRDVEAGVGALEGVQLCDIDALETIATRGLEFRKREVAHCEAVITTHVADFTRWLANPLTSSKTPKISKRP